MVGIERGLVGPRDIHIELASQSGGNTISPLFPRHPTPTNNESENFPSTARRDATANGRALRTLETTRRRRQIRKLISLLRLSHSFRELC